MQPLQLTMNSSHLRHILKNLQWGDFVLRKPRRVEISRNRQKRCRIYSIHESGGPAGSNLILSSGWRSHMCCFFDARFIYQIFKYDRDVVLETRNSRHSKWEVDHKVLPSTGLLIKTMRCSPFCVTILRHLRVQNFWVTFPKKGFGCHSFNLQSLIKISSVLVWAKWIIRVCATSDTQLESCFCEMRNPNACQKD